MRCGRGPRLAAAAPGHQRHGRRPVRSTADCATLGAVVHPRTPTPGPAAPTDIAAVVVAYAAVSALWILLSDRTVAWLFSDPAWQAQVQTFKGWIFVAVTSVLLFVLLRRLQAAREAVQARETAALRAQARAAQLLQALVEHSTDAIFAKDRDGRYLLFNREAARITGRTAASVLGHDDAAVFPASQAALMRLSDRRVTALGLAQTFEQEIDTADGRRVFLTTKAPLRDAHGMVGLFGISRDISAMVQARRALADREHRYRTLFDANPQPVWVFDLSTLQFLDVNVAAIAHYGYTREEFLSMTLADIRPPEHRAVLAQNLGERRPATESGSSVSGPWVHWRKDGSLIEVEISYNDIEVDGRAARLVLVLDVTERQRLLRERDAAADAREQAFAALTRREAELARSELRYRLAAMGGHVWDWDIAARCADYPTTFWQRLGHAPPAGPDAPAFLAELVHPDDRARWHAALRDHLKGRVPYELEFRARDAAGAWHWFYTRGQAVWDDAGRARYMAGTTFDVTERHAVEDSLLRTQQELSDLAQQLLAQERETTTRLAHALHDQLGQTLAGTRLQLDVAIPRCSGAGAACAERLQRVSTLVDTAIADVRSLLIELRPPLLRERGLAAALDNELRRGLGAGADLSLELQAGPAAAEARWPDAVEYAVFMIAREAVANALRHADARRVILTLRGDGQTLAFGLRDDGRGIGDTELEGRPGHLGLVGMRERAIAIGARLAVRRRPEGGTEVRLDWTAQQP